MGARGDAESPYDTESQMFDIAPSDPIIKTYLKNLTRRNEIRKRLQPEAFKYRLGSRSALEWIVDQYQVKGESDPNRADDPGYIVRLVGQVVRVSVETVRIVRQLPDYR